MLPEIVAVQSQDKQHRRLWSKIKFAAGGVLQPAQERLA